MKRPCICGCGRPRKARGLSKTCHKRWIRWGRPETVPPPRMRGPSRSKADRMEDYFELRSWGESRQDAALRIGVSERTAWRYEFELRQIRERNAAA